MAKKAERKAREEAERRVSGVPIKTPPAAPAPQGVAAAGPGAVSAKDVKKAARAARAGKIGEAGSEGQPSG